MSDIVSSSGQPQSPEETYVSDEEQHPDPDVAELKAAEDIKEGAAVAVNADGEAVNAAPAEPVQQTESPEVMAARLLSERAKRAGFSPCSNMTIREYMATHILSAVICNPLEGGNASRHGFNAPDTWTRATVLFVDRLLLELEK